MAAGGCYNGVPSADGEAKEHILMIERGSEALDQVTRDVTACQACPRLRAHCQEVARVQRAAYRHETYWGRPVHGFGDPHARILIVGLAPGAHGANRTGRLFTGDRSADFLFASLHRTGWANQPNSTHVDDGLRMKGAFISAVGRCAPPDNRPTPEEIRRCLPFLVREITHLRHLRVVVALGQIAFAGIWAAFELLGPPPRRPRPVFGHCAVIEAMGADPVVIASYHPSQQNTQTGRLTPAMLDRVFLRARELADRKSCESAT
jgi:uracil-DNA glycosylase family 4